MGRSLYLRVVFGIRSEIGENPWDRTEDFDGDYVEWWRSLKGFQPIFCPYDEQGNYRKSISEGDPRIAAYHAERRAWDEANPIPFDTQADGEPDSDEIFICAPDRPRFYDSVELTKVVQDAKIEPGVETAFRSFLKEYYGDVEPTWWLVPFYG